MGQAYYFLARAVMVAALAALALTAHAQDKVMFTFAGIESVRIAENVAARITVQRTNKVKIIIEGSTDERELIATEVRGAEVHISYEGSAFATAPRVQILAPASVAVIGGSKKARKKARAAVMNSDDDQGYIDISRALKAVKLVKEPLPRPRVKATPEVRAALYQTRSM